MTVSECLQHSTKVLTQAGIATARLDALVLLEDILHTNRAQLLAEPAMNVTPEQQEELSIALARRTRHEPLSYIRGKTEFYGRAFSLNRHVLEPRAESEAIIDLLKTSHLPAHPIIVDVGTGSGALAITAKLELPHADVFGIDIDRACLSIANQNATTLRADCTFLEGDLLQPLPSDIIPHALLCNLPYVPDDFQINAAAMHEPRLAIFGGPDGLDLYRMLFAQVQARELPNLLVFTESLPRQHAALANIAAAHGYAQTDEVDFIQVFKTSSAPSS